MITPPERIVVARHVLPTGEIQLQQRWLADGTPAFEMIVDGVFLMASYNQISERALALWAVEALEPGSQAGLRILIGGLGMGFTLQETLSYQNVATVEVVEVNPWVIEWNQTYFGALNGMALADPRVILKHEDIWSVLQPPLVATYHAILLDVDNGPSWLAQPDNARLYTVEALQGWAARLAPGGSLVVWSAQQEPEFLERLRATFNGAEELPVVAVDERQRPVEHFIYRGTVLK